MESDKNCENGEREVKGKAPNSTLFKQNPVVIEDDFSEGAGDAGSKKGDEENRLGGSQELDGPKSKHSESGERKPGSPEILVVNNVKDEAHLPDSDSSEEEVLKKPQNFVRVEEVKQDENVLDSAHRKGKSGKAAVPNLSPMRFEPTESKSPNPQAPVSPGKKKEKAKEEEKLPEWKEKMIAFLDSIPVTIIMTLWTLYALFGDDIRLLGTSKSADPAFFSLTIIAMVFFIAEIVLSSIAKPDYLFGFYFWLDVISTLSMVMDIGWIWDPILTGGYSDAASQAQKVSQMARASRGARLGSKASKLVRVIRLIRMLRIVKLYKASNTATTDKEKKEKKEKTEEEAFIEEMIRKRNLERQKEEEKELEQIPEESKIGQVLSEVTTKTVIVMVLVVMLSVALFSYFTYVTETKSFQIGIDFITNYDSDPNGTAFKASYESYLNYHRGLRTPVIFLRARYLGYNDPDTNYLDLRITEKEIVSPSDSEFEETYIAVFDLREDTQMDALLGMVATVFVCIMLTIGAFMFTKDATDLVIAPIEQMMGKVRRIAKNPLEAAKTEEEETLALITAEREEREKDKTRCCKRKKEEPTETYILEQTIVKTGALLAIGLGEAGSKVIAQNIGSSDTGGSINPLIPGAKVFAIFGFCDIRNFTDTTEILQEEVMVFVNEIAEIVHGKTHRYLGAPNKNIGDAFLIVWKYPDKDVETVGDSLKLKDSPNISIFADLAAISFILVIADINKSKKIAKYRSYKELNDRMPNYRVKMGFGIHAGWAIEGAIGSEYKIDASYISPHVNLTMALEEATKIYGVPFVISEHYYRLLSPELQQAMRPLDVVKISGFEDITTIYTFDVDINNIEVDATEEKEMDQMKAILERINARNSREYIQKGVESGEFRISSKLKSDKDIKALHAGYTKEFIALYKKGFDLYVKGDWPRAKEIFEEVREIKDDNPSATLIEYMKGYHFAAPPDWAGHHNFNEK